MSNLNTESVKRVRQALINAGVGDKVQELSETARSAADAAKALGVDKGAIVKTLVFMVGNRFVLALVSGDHTCKEDQIARALNMQGAVTRPGADLVRAATGFSIGGVAPVGGHGNFPVVIDANLKRFDKVFAAAGHPHCVFETSLDELKNLTGGLVSYAVAQPEKAAPKA